MRMMDWCITCLACGADYQEKKLGGVQCPNCGSKLGQVRPPTLAEYLDWKQKGVLR